MKQVNCSVLVKGLSRAASPSPVCHWRTRVRSPMPHVLEHPDTWLHSPQPPPEAVPATATLIGQWPATITLIGQHRASGPVTVTLTGQHRASVLSQSR